MCGLTLAALLFAAAPAIAQRTSWSISGPRGDATSETPAWLFIAASGACPSTEIFLYGAGVLVSNDRGATWRPPSFDDFIFAQDPADPRVLYVEGTSGLERTDDGGKTFVSIQEGIGRRVLSVAIDPFDTRTIYAGVDAGCITMCLPPGGIYKSIDRGAHWTHLSFPDVDVGYLDTDPFQEGVVYANWLRSDDGGTTWEELGTPTIPFVVRSVPSLLYGFSFDYLGDATILASTDRGRTWVPVGGPLPFAQALASSPGDPRVLLVGTYQSGIFRSTDGGVTWKATDLDTGQVVSLAFDFCDPSLVYASGADRQGREFFLSRDGGVHFERQGVFLADVSSVAIDPNVPSTVYTAGSGGVFRSSDAGAHWSDGNGIGVSELAVDSSSRVFGASGSQVASSKDGGETWAFSTVSPEPYLAISSIAFGRTSDVFAGTNQGLMRSRDNGEHWGTVLDGSVGRLASSTGEASVIFASRDEIPVNPISRSSDEGETWQTCGPMPIWRVSALASARDANVLYVAGAGEFGDTWLFRSADGCSGFPTLAWKGRITSIAASPVDDSTVYVAGSRENCDDGTSCGNGVWMSRDAGETWSALLRPRPDCEVTKISSAPDGSMIHAASACGEVDVRTEPAMILPVSAPVALRVGR